MSQHYPKEKPRRTPKYKIFRKVMSCKEIPSFIQRVMYGLILRKPHVPDNNIPWKESRNLKLGYTSLSQRESQPQCNEVQGDAMEQGGVP